MIIKHNEKKLDKFYRDSLRKPKTKEEFKYFSMYIQMAEICDNGYTLSIQPWKWRKFHKLTGDRSNQYSFGISKTNRTICYGNNRKELNLKDVTIIEFINYVEDYH